MLSTIALAAAAGGASAQPPGAYAQVNGLKLYYEMHGAATSASPPLILLHGGVGGIEMFGPNLLELARDRRVIAVELQGHGRTADVDRPLRYELMADDIAALLRHLRIAKADLMGYSLGGGVALQTAIRHAGAVRKLVLVSTPFKREAFYPEVLAMMDQMGPAAGAGMKQSPLYTMYPDVDWPKLFGKLGDLLRQPYDWSADVAKLKVQTMLVYADADSFQPSQIVEFYRLLGGGKRDAGLDGSGRAAARLAIVPGATHYDILSSTVVAELVRPFLDAPAPGANGDR
jgi:pimeloyl-ACP methyl ester carboxylesterase